MLREDVAQILALDFLSRKTKKWPLVDFTDLIARDIRKLHGEDDLLCATPHCEAKLQTLDRALGKIDEDFPALKILLEKFGNNIALCGGCLTNAVTKTRYHGEGHPDADIFFYGNITEAEATTILKNCIEIIVNYHSDIYEVRVERRKHITNVVVSKNIDTFVIYQFIHRIYPSLDSIIGGFDLGPCMIAYDGKKILLTEIGAWCISRSACILDVSRRSTSFEYRILKYYNRGFTIVFPGLNAEKLISETSMNLSKEERMQKVADVMKEMRIDFNSDMTGTYFEGRFTHSDVFDEKYPSIKIGKMGIEIGTNRRNQFQLVKILESTIKDGVLKPESLAKYSDYSHGFCATYLIPFANASMLRCGNLDGIILYTIFKRERENVRDDIDKLFSSCEVIYDTSNFKKIIGKQFLRIIRASQSDYISYTGQNIRCFGEYLAEVKRFARMLSEAEKDLYKKPSIYTNYGSRKSDEELEKQVYEKFGATYEEFLLKKTHDNLQKAKESLTTMTWITQDPQRQWTSSINPIVTNPRDYYGERYYVKFNIGIPEEVETLLRCAYKKCTIFKMLNKDVFEMLLRYLFCAYIR